MASTEAADRQARVRLNVMLAHRPEDSRKAARMTATNPTTTMRLAIEKLKYFKSDLLIWHVRVRWPDPNFRRLGRPRGIVSRQWPSSHRLSLDSVLRTRSVVSSLLITPHLLPPPVDFTAASAEKRRSRKRTNADR